MAIRPGSKKAVAEINVTPLVDVVLVLLIIFMVVTPLAAKQMFMRVPEYQPPDVVVEPEPPNQVVLLVRKDGRVFLNRDDVSIEEAMATLRAAFDGHPSKALFLGAEDGVQYDVVVRVADRARKAGVNTIGLLTEDVMSSALP
jgi:biopolymer transport protein TolR